MAASQKYEATATLRDTISHKPYGLICKMITDGFKALKKPTKRLSMVVQFLETRYVLNEHNIRLTAFDKPGEVRKQRHSIIFIS